MLADSFGRIATDLRVSLTDRCNLRCAYCMPPEGLDWLPAAEQLTDDEVVRLIRVGVERLGIREVRFTGGEPLLRRGVAGLIAPPARVPPPPADAPIPKPLRPSPRTSTLTRDDTRQRGPAPAEACLVDGGPARVGVIASVTRPFCGTCDRVRLTADGQVRNCLFARTESDLRGPLRAGAGDDELTRAWRPRPGGAHARARPPTPA